MGMSREQEINWGGRRSSRATAPPAPPPRGEGRTAPAPVDEHAPDGWEPRALTGDEAAQGTLGQHCEYARALRTCIPFGKRFKGRTFAAISRTPAGRAYLAWLWGRMQKDAKANPGYTERMLGVFMAESGVKGNGGV